MNRVRGAAIKDIQLGVVMQEMLDIALQTRRADPGVAGADGEGAGADAVGGGAARSERRSVRGRGPFHHALDDAARAGQSRPKDVVLRSAEVEDSEALRLLEALERLVGARPGEKLEVNFKGTSLEDTIWSAGRQLALGVDRRIRVARQRDHVERARTGATARRAVASMAFWRGAGLASRSPWSVAGFSVADARTARDRPSRRREAR